MLLMDLELVNLHKPIVIKEARGIAAKNDPSATMNAKNMTTLMNVINMMGK